MTEQTFHVTGLDPRTALCGRNGHIWAAPDWPEELEMRAGLFTRCKDCHRLATPAVRSALQKARSMELATLTAFRNGWREGSGVPQQPPEPAPAETYNALRECRELGRRIGAEASRLIREAQDRDPQPAHSAQ